MRKFIVPLAIVLGIGLAVGCLVWSIGNKDEGLASDQLIRLHVIANSDSSADQALKYRVRDRVINQMEPVFAQAADINEVRQRLRDNLPQIQALAAATVGEAGEDYPVAVYFGPANFPTKSYGSLTLPAGRYEAVRIVIGDGQGANWWCVLFPPLCFVNIANGIADNGGGTPAQPPQVRLKSLEWLKSKQGQLAKLMDE